MQRYGARLAAGALALAVLLAGAGDFSRTGVALAADGPTLAQLGGGQFGGGQLAQELENVQVVAGKVVAVEGSSLTVARFDSGENVAFTLTSETRVRRLGAFRSGQTASVTPKVGDIVAVVTMDETSNARFVIIGNEQIIQRLQQLQQLRQSQTKST